MRILLAWFGYELDVTFGPTTVDDEPEPEFKPYQDAGYTGSTIVGFAPNIAPQWDDQGWRYTLDPDDDNED